MCPPLHTMIQWFKTMTTNHYILSVKSGKSASFYKKLWQRNFHEHIIRNENNLFKTQNYIKNNPKKWELDEFYQKN